MKFILFFLIFLVINSGSSVSDKEEIQKLFKELTDLELPEDCKIVRNELHGDFQTNDSDFSRDIILKFSEKSFEELVSSIKNSDNYICDTPEELSGTLPRKALVLGEKIWLCDDAGVDLETSNGRYAKIFIHINYRLKEMWIELYV